MADTFRDALAAALGTNYSIERELTGGGMSRVFVATEAALGRTVVVKVLREEFAADVNRERFRREITLAAQLQHPHIVPLLQAGEHGDLLWYTMPFVEGESVRDEVRRGRKFTVKDLVRLLHDVLDALSYAHSRGVIHRDIKPGNILRHGNHSLVTDFGVAKALSAARPQSGTTSTGMAIGTPAYMAPEQLAADPAADHRVDLYAVGLVAYEVLTSVQPFAESSPQATMAAQLTRMPEPIHLVRPDVPAALSSLIMRLLAKNPDDRPKSALAAIDELDSLTTPVEVAGMLRSATSPTRRGMRLVAALAVVAAISVPLISSRRAAARERASAIEAARRDSMRADSVRVARSESVRRDSLDRATKARTLAASRAARDSIARTKTGTATKTAASAGGSGSNRGLLAPRFATPRKIALLPPRYQPTTADDVVRALRTVQDSVRNAFIAAGYTIATADELVELLSAGSELRRRVALSQNVGALLNLDLVPRGGELYLRAQMIDTWRNQSLSDDETADRGAPMELLGIVRSTARMADRVSWRTVNEPKAVLVFDFDNSTGVDSLAVVSNAMGDHVRALVVKLGMRVVGDSSARIVRDVTERRQTAQRIGVGASIAGNVYRLRGDTLLLRMSVRDHSEEANSPNVEARVPRARVTEALPALLDRLTALLNAVNWGPKKG